MRNTRPNVLLVEGEEDKRVIPQIMEANGVRWGERSRGERTVVHTEPYDGIERLLQPGAIETYLKASGLRALGIVADADDSCQRRWTRIRNGCSSRFPSLPAEIPKEGLVIDEEGGLRFGVWLMPDNGSRGMMETFLACLRPLDNKPLLDFTRTAHEQAMSLGAPCKSAHSDKAQIHTWLAWQAPPGRQLHQAVMERMLDPRAPGAASFVRWFKVLFSL